MEKSKYYYCRDSNNRPVVTVCLLKSNGNIAQGVAICSLLDNPCKKTGRKIARDRAIHAMKTRSNNCDIATSQAHLVLSSVHAAGAGIFGFKKSSYNPPLTQLENKIIYGSL